MKFFANMFEKWSKRKFHLKCKANIDSALTRIEWIRRRRNAMVKYLRSDIAELLRNGYDSEAYGRVGRLYLDQIRSLCYDLIEQFCITLNDLIITMNDQSECPEECREAVSSLTYAAARIADLPELRALRSLFFDKYGDSFESSVNKELVNLLRPDRPTKEMKIQLMREIALEHGVEWDCKSLEQKLYKPPLSEDDCSESAYGDQENEYRITNHENGWKVHNDLTEIERKAENMRQRLLDYNWSRTTSSLSTSRETTSPEESSSSSSSSSNDSTKSKPSFLFRLMPPYYVKKNPNKNSSNSTTNKQKHENGNKENEVSNYPNVENGENEKVKSRRRIKGGDPSRGKSHSTVSPPRSVHPKLPDYDDIIARFAALRAKSS